MAAELVTEAVPRPAADVIAYIPPDPDRLLERGHHPAERLARELGRRWDLDVVPTLQVIGHRAKRQASLGRDERLRNARGAFVALAAPARRIALVDDVYTTGATAAAAASALRRAGTETVEVVTFARTTRL
jgi:predicted amidophosphoribosyltransferase